jgi:hypothetical protein
MWKITQSKLQIPKKGRFVLLKRYVSTQYDMSAENAILEQMLR